MRDDTSESESEPLTACPAKNDDGEAVPGVRQPKRGNEQARAERWKAFLCFDVEATCRGGKEFAWPNEIIVGLLILQANSIGGMTLSAEA